MRYRGSILITLFLSLLLVQLSVKAQQEVSGQKVNIQITSCVVNTVKHAGGAYDCMAEAKKALGTCSEAQACEIPIGLNLTSGRDLDPGSGFLGKRVTILYVCGSEHMQAGPYEQDDHASLVLDCSGMWW